MTDETGGKPLMGRITFGTAPPEAASLHALPRPEFGVTIPTAALTELVEAAKECARLLEERVDADHRFHNIVPAERLMHKINSAPVRRLRAAVARVRGGE